MRPALPALLLLTLSACAVAPPQRPAADAGQQRAAWLERVQRLRAVDSFVLTGRFSSSTMAVKGDLRWRQLPQDRFELRVTGPFGIGALELRGDAQSVEVRSKEGVFQTTDPEGWLRERYGWSLPIAGLRYWALGVPAPGIPATLDFDTLGRAARLQQGGWSIDYAEYADASALSLPRRFDADNQQVRLRLLIDRWEQAPRPEPVP